MWSSYNSGFFENQRPCAAPHLLQLTNFVTVVWARERNMATNMLLNQIHLQISF